MYVCILPCMYLCGYAYAMASLWRSEDLRSQLFFHLVGPVHRIKWSGLAASTFISCAILLGPTFFFMVVGSYHLTIVSVLSSLGKDLFERQLSYSLAQAGLRRTTVFLFQPSKS